MLRFSALLYSVSIENTMSDSSSSQLDPWFVVIRISEREILIGFRYSWLSMKLANFFLAILAYFLGIQTDGKMFVSHVAYEQFLFRKDHRL